MAEVLEVQDMLANTFEPKRKFRWLLAIEGIDAFLLKSAARPSFTTEEIEINYINATRYLASKYKFETIEVSLHDAIAPSGAQQVMEWIRLAHEHVTQRAGYADFYKRDIQLKMLDPLGSVVELWDIKGAFIQASNFGELAYDSMDSADITLTIRFDLAVLQY
jgi:hypothetical protein